MVKKDNARQQTQLIVKRGNGFFRDLNGREITPGDVDREIESATNLPVMPHVAVAVSHHSRGRVCLQNSTYLWFQQDDEQEV